MDDLAAAFLGPGDDASIQEEDEGQQGSGSGTESSTTTARTLRRGILKAANLQDKLLEKYFTTYLMNSSVSQLWMSLT